MSKSDALQRVRFKTERAKKHIKDLEREVVNFLCSEPYALSRQFEPPFSRTAFRISKEAPIPANIPLIAGDAIQNLRSSLDHLMRTLSHAPQDSRDVAFPIFKSIEAYTANVKSKIKLLQIGKDVADVLQTCKPYKGGENTLWVIHELNNIDKHRVLFAIYMVIEHLNIHYSGKAPILKYPPGTVARPPLHDQDVFFYVPGDRVNDDQFNPAIDIAIYEPGVLEGEPLLKTIHEMAKVVDSIINSFTPFLG